MKDFCMARGFTLLHMLIIADDGSVCERDHCSLLVDFYVQQLAERQNRHGHTFKLVLRHEEVVDFNS